MMRHCLPADVRIVSQCRSVGTATCLFARLHSTSRLTFAQGRAVLGRASMASTGSFNWQDSCASEENKQVFPAAEKNKGPILEVLSRLLPPSGTVLEVASGTGQHIAHFAAALPQALTWQPSDLTDELFLSIRSHCNGFSNVKHPVMLDASSSTWPVEGPLAAVIVANLTHIAPWKATLGLIAGSGRLLQPGGLLCIYGPFKLDGKFTTASNQDFHDHLVSTNSAW